MKGKILFLLFLLLGIIQLPAQQGDLSFYGWSKEGKLALLQGSSAGWAFSVFDTVTDEIVASIGPESGTQDSFMTRQDSRIKKLLADNKIIASTPEVIKGNAFESRGISYNVKIIEEKGSTPDSTGRIPSLAISVLIESSRGDEKVIYRYRDNGKGEPLTGFVIKGILLSPYEKRAAVICHEDSTVSGAVVSGYRIIGAHLTVGYQQTAKPGSSLIQAVLNGQYYIVRMLLDDGANPETKDKRGFSALLLACRNGKWEIALLLATRGAKPDIRDDKGRSPLHYAAEAGRVELSRVLVEHGAPRAVTDNAGKTPYALASDKGYSQAAGVVKP